MAFRCNFTIKRLLFRHMNISTDKKTLGVLAGIALAVVLAATLFVVKGNELNQSRDPKARVAELMQNGVDTSQSLFLPEETQSVLAKVEERREKFVSGTDSTAQNLMDMARHVRDLRDHDLALELFAVVDTLKPVDIFYKIDVARIYLERQQWEEARKVLEPLRLTLPIRETFIELAKAYQNIEGTPNYVIDEIYEEGIFRSFEDFEVLEAYVKWLEQTGREEKTIPYYEKMNQKVPQKILEDRIKELKDKYNK